MAYFSESNRPTEKQILDSGANELLMYISCLNTIYTTDHPGIITQRYNYLSEVVNSIINHVKQKELSVSLNIALVLFSDKNPKEKIDQGVIDFLATIDKTETPELYLREKIYFPNLLRAYNHSFEYKIEDINSSKTPASKKKKLIAFLEDLNKANSILSGKKHNIPEIIQYIEGEINKLK